MGCLENSSDHGAAFLSKLLHEVYRLMGIILCDKVSTTAYHPQTDGLVGRFHRTLTAMLSKTTQPGGSDWDEILHIGAANQSLRVNPHFSRYMAETQFCLPRRLCLNQSSDATWNMMIIDHRWFKTLVKPGL